MLICICISEQKMLRGNFSFSFQIIGPQSLTTNSKIPKALKLKVFS